MKGAQSYRIVVGAGALERCAADIAPGGALGFSSSTAVVVITDRNVWRCHGARLMGALEAVGLQPLLKILPPGEEAKTRSIKEDIEDWMLASG
jgi:3-dehydroquinate synthetase